MEFMMRKILVMLAVCALAVPAVAGDITFSVTQTNPGEFTIGYVATTDVPVGMGIAVSLTDATIPDGSTVSVDSFFDVFVDFASEDPCNYAIGMAGQTPIADPCAAGQPAYGAGISEFSICMGALDPCNAAAGTVANLITIAVDCTADFDVAISADSLRGGIVGATFDNVYFVNGTDLPCGGWDGPACWLSLTQCHGDADDDGDVDTTDWPAFRDGFGKSYPDALYLANVCGDYDQDGDVDTTDWPAFRDNFGGIVSADCVMPIGTWPPTP
jgi:hypothetical protein